MIVNYCSENLLFLRNNFTLFTHFENMCSELRIILHRMHYQIRIVEPVCFLLFFLNLLAVRA